MTYQPDTPPVTVAVPLEMVYSLAVYATRYALGRRSYAVSQVAEWVASVAPLFPPGSRYVILRDIQEQRAHGSLGDAWDVESWERLEQHLLALGVDQ